MSTVSNSVEQCQQCQQFQQLWRGATSISDGIFDDYKVDLSQQKTAQSFQKIFASSIYILYIVYKLCRGDKPEWERGLTFLRKPPGHNIRVHTQYAVNVVLENLEATLLNQNRKNSPFTNVACHEVNGQ